MQRNYNKIKSSLTLEINVVDKISTKNFNSMIENIQGLEKQKTAEMSRKNKYEKFVKQQKCIKFIYKAHCIPDVV